MEYKQVDINFKIFKYNVEATGLRVIKKGFGNSSDTLFEFENIGSKIIHQKSRKIVLLIFSILFLGLALLLFFSALSDERIGYIAGIFPLILSSVFFLLYKMTRKNALYIMQEDYSNAIEFIGTKIYQNQLADFIRDLFEVRDKYLIEKYANLTDFLPYAQQYNNLVWLHNLALLSKEQLEEKIKELNEIDARTLNPKKNELEKITGFIKKNETSKKIIS